MKFNLKQFIFGITIGIIAISFISFSGIANAGYNSGQCNENNPKNCPAPTQICNKGEHEGNPHCQPTATPTVKPTATPTPTDKPKCWEDDCVSNTPTPTPTPTCGWNVDHPCTTVTPTPTDEVTPTPTDTPSQPSGGQGGGGGQSNNPPPVAQCGTPFDAPHIVSFTNKDTGTVNFAWTEGQTVDKYSITYGYSEDNLNMGEDNIPGNVTNWDIHQLNPGSHVWAQVQAWFHGCEESSNVFDPKVK